MAVRSITDQIAECANLTTFLHFFGMTGVFMVRSIQHFLGTEPHPKKFREPWSRWFSTPYLNERSELGKVRQGVNAAAHEPRRTVIVIPRVFAGWSKLRRSTEARGAD